jgi:hypothetical protein
MVLMIQKNNQFLFIYDSLQLYQRKVFLNLQYLYRTLSIYKNTNIFRFVSSNQIQHFLPNSFLKYLHYHGFSNEFIQTPYLGHPLAVWPRKLDFSKNTWREAYRIFPYFLKSITTLSNPSFIINVYETMRDAYCVESMYSFFIWFILSPLLFFHIFLLFF